MLRRTHYVKPSEYATGERVKAFCGKRIRIRKNPPPQHNRVCGECAHLARENDRTYQGQDLARIHAIAMIMDTKDSDIEFVNNSLFGLMRDIGYYPPPSEEEMQTMIDDLQDKQEKKAYNVVSILQELNEEKAQS